jgi:hypothetical protein
LVSLFCLILPIFSIISLIQCSVSVNIVDVFTIGCSRNTSNRRNTWTTYIFRRERGRTHRAPDKYSQIISLIQCSVSVNIVDVFTFFIISSMIATFLQSLWFFTIQIPQHGHSCSLQYKLNFSWMYINSRIIQNICFPLFSPC